jgi:hypothetical protein
MSKGFHAKMSRFFLEEVKEHFLLCLLQPFLDACCLVDVLLFEIHLLHVVLQGKRAEGCSILMVYLGVMHGVADAGARSASLGVSISGFLC